VLLELELLDPVKLFPRDKYKINMTNNNQNKKIEEHLAKAQAHNLAISTKHAVEICRHLRYKTTHQAKQILENTINLSSPVPFLKFKTDIGHKAGMAAGRFPQKAAKEVLKLIKTVEANAQFKGLNTSYLKISKILANKAAIPLTGGRSRTGTKRSHLEIEVKESQEKKKKVKNKPAEEKKKENSVLKTAKRPKRKEEIKKETPQEEVKEEKQEEVKERIEIKEKSKEVKEEKTEIKQEPKERHSKTTETGEFTK